jgi:hypothetical protein
MSRKRLSTRSLEQETLLTSLQREWDPYLRQTGKLVEAVAPESPPEITGSRSFPTFILTELLAALDKAGIIKDSTTP